MVHITIMADIIIRNGLEYNFNPWANLLVTLVSIFEPIEKYHYESPHMYRSYAYNKYPDVKTDSCYECSSIGGSNPICDDMDDKYGASATDV